MPGKETWTDWTSTTAKDLCFWVKVFSQYIWKIILALNACHQFHHPHRPSESDPSNVSDLDTGAFSLVSAELLDVTCCCTTSDFCFSSSARCWIFLCILKMSSADKNSSRQNLGSRAEAIRLVFGVSSVNSSSFCHFQLFHFLQLSEMPVCGDSQMKKWSVHF